jgi:hypothetical protein
MFQNEAVVANVSDYSSADLSVREITVHKPVIVHAKFLNRKLIAGFLRVYMQFRPGKAAASVRLRCFRIGDRP